MIVQKFFNRPLHNSMSCIIYLNIYYHVQFQNKILLRYHLYNVVFGNFMWITLISCTVKHWQSCLTWMMMKHTRIYPNLYNIDKLDLGWTNGELIPFLCEFVYSLNFQSNNLFKVISVDIIISQLFDFNYFFRFLAHFNK